MAIKASIKAIDYYLPEGKLTNVDLNRRFPEWSVEKIEEKTGIVERRVCAEDECASDLAYEAARKLIERLGLEPETIDYLILCTQSPDFFLPTSACLIQERLGLSTKAGAIDVNLGCSGYVYSLSLAKGLIESGQVDNVLLLTADTYSKYIHPGDKSVRTLFGDGASATLVEGAEQDSESSLGPFVFGTDGTGAMSLCVRNGGLRYPKVGESESVEDAFGNVRSEDNLFMNGPEIFTFTLRAVPKAVRQLLERAGKQLEDIDLFVFHQANVYMLNALRRKIKIPEDRFYLYIREIGNTVSSTIPIALSEALAEGRLKRGDLVMLVGFGVGFSWGASLVHWL